jgi:hypothetical protein
LQELAVVRIVVDVDFVFCKHKALAGYNMTLFEKSFHFLASRKKNIQFVDIFVHTIRKKQLINILGEYNFVKWRNPND